MIKKTARLLAGFLVSLSLWGGVVAAQGTYTIRAGDTLTVEVLEDTSLNRSVLVLPDGSITFPFVGTLPASGKTVDELTGQLAAGLAPNFAVSPTVFVSVSSLRAPRVSGGTPAPATIGVFITGEIANPGQVDVKPGTTILQLIAQSGGLTRFAAQRRIELRRINPQEQTVTRYLFSYDGRGSGARISGATPLAEGDVVVVPERGLFE